MVVYSQTVGDNLFPAYNTMVRVIIVFVTSKFHMNFKQFIPGVWHFSVLNLFAILSLLVYLFANSIDINDSLLFWSPDSREYFAAGTDFWRGTFGEAAARRTLLYPLFLLITHGAGGAKAIFFIQVIAWLISSNIIASSTYVITRKSTFYVLAGFGFLINFSIMSMTMQALTEVITILLLSIIVFFVARNFQQRQSPHFIVTIVFLFSLLAVIRPVFIHLLTLTVLIALVFYHRALVKRPRYVFFFLLSISPVIAQVTLMHRHYNILGVSKIGVATRRYYLVTRAMHDEFHETYDSTAYQQAMKVAATMTKQEIINHVSEHPGLYAKQIKQNLMDNISAGSTFIHPESCLRRFMKHVNNGYFVMHFIALLMMIFLVIRFGKQSLSELLLPIIFLLPAWYIILTSGISFWQGDRLILPAWPLCVIGYLLLANRIIELRNKNEMPTLTEQA